MCYHGRHVSINFEDNCMVVNDSGIEAEGNLNNAALQCNPFSLIVAK